MADALGAINEARQNIPSISMGDVGGSATDFITGAYQPVDSAFDQYASKVLSNEKPLDLYTRLENQAGIPEMRQTSSTLRGQIGKTEDTLRGIEPDITNRTQNSLVTDAQRRGMVTAESKPLNDFLDRISTALGRNEQSLTAAGQGISTKVGLQLQGDEIQNQVYKERVSFLSDKAARLTTGFTEDRQLRYSMLQDKINKGFELTKMEIAELSQLAADERSFNFQKDQMTRQYDYMLRNDLATAKAKGTGDGTGNTNFGKDNKTSDSDYAWDGLEDSYSYNPADYNNNPDSILSEEQSTNNQQQGSGGWFDSIANALKTPRPTESKEQFALGVAQPKQLGNPLQWFLDRASDSRNRYSEYRNK